MRTTMRIGSFETNSSSTHSLVMCTQGEFDDWKGGKLLYDRDWARFIDAGEADMDDEEADWRYLSHDDVFDWRSDKIEMDTFQSTYTTPGGETVVAFGWYGYDG